MMAINENIRAPCMLFKAFHFEVMWKPFIVFLEVLTFVLRDGLVLVLLQGTFENDGDYPYEG